ncbi:hypothetical protein [Polymorphobacter sp.]|uniref:hypothetical protein n=1 Tax=Polymorphobacter sp. TaxID=1909290 RepID=UPI003F7191E2
MTLLLLAPAVIGQPAPAPAPAPAPQGPRSLLPQGFGPPREPTPVAPAPPLPGTTLPDTGPEEAPLPGTVAEGDPLEAPLAGVEVPADGVPFRDPLAARSMADAALVGVLTPTSGGFAGSAFASADGRFLAGLARRIEAPIASRWAAIALRRALISRAEPPARISAGDWVATRALLLMRMGEIDAAKLLVDRLPVEAYSAATYRVAGQVALAAADLGALCPIARTGRQISQDPMWEMALGICAALEGDDISAAALFDRLQQQRSQVAPFDVRLAERVATMAGGGGRAANVDWAEAPPLTPWRFGVAVASGLVIPAEALAALGPARHGWLIRQPGLAADVRLAALPIAAVQGSASSRELVSGLAALAPDDGTESLPARLRAAFAGASTATRLAAMQSIWGAKVDGFDDEQSRYAGLLQTSAAAARMAPSAAAAESSADLIASLLSAGDVRAARRWWPVAQTAAAPVRARAWALLAVAGAVPATPSEFDDWQSATDADDRASARLLAALSGLGAARGAGWSGLASDLLPAADSRWSRAIRAAGAARRPGEVVMLAATGLQGRWADVPALHVLAITEALVASGHRDEARLFAAEALTRTA